MNKLAIRAIVLCVAGLPRLGDRKHRCQNIRISKEMQDRRTYWLAGPSEALPDRDESELWIALLAAIRLHSVRSAPGGDDASDRLKEPIGACASTVQFRPWRILQFKNEVQIEGMPQPGKNGHNAERRTSVHGVCS